MADGGSSAALVDFIGALPGFSVTVPSGAGLVAQVKASVQLAEGVGTPFILYTEPDKELFFGAALTEFIRRAASGSEVGVVLAARDDRSLRTFPPMQRYTEGVVNHLCAELIGYPGDYCYGPFLLNRALAPVVAAAPVEIAWGWRPFVFRAAQHSGLQVVHVRGNYPCPPAQQTEDDEERTHRMRQLVQNVLGLIAATD